MSEYDAEENLHRMDQLYTIITRWGVILTFPIFALFLLFPEPLLVTFFGNGYRSGGLVLSILAIGYFTGRFVGLSGSFLIARGNTKVLMYISGATATLNLVLNIILIPIFGIVGAAIATVSSTLLNNGLQSIYIYKSARIHPFTKNLVVPIGLGLIFLVSARQLLSNSAVDN